MRMPGGPTHLGRRGCFLMALLLNPLKGHHAQLHFGCPGQAVDVHFKGVLSLLTTGQVVDWRVWLSSHCERRCG